jgi:hypothetical protein
MAEFALRIIPEVVAKDKYDEVSPVGAVLSGFSDRIIRRHWLEMVCDLARPSVTYRGRKLPSKREKFFARMVANCGWTPERCKAIAELWSEPLWRRWMETEAPKKDEHGRDIPWVEEERDIAKGQLWDGDIASASGWVAAVGKEPNGVEDVVNTVPWSLENLKHFCVVAADGLTATEAESLSGKKLDVVDFREIVMPRHVIDWDADLGLTLPEKDAILEPSIPVFPRFDRKVGKPKIQRCGPNVRALREAMRK